MVSVASHEECGVRDLRRRGEALGSRLKLGEWLRSKDGDWILVAVGTKVMPQDHF